MSEKEGGAWRPEIVDFQHVAAVRCPCGWARRAFTDLPDSPLSIHWVCIEADTVTHYHRDHTETYYVLDCEPGAALELDGNRIPVAVGTAVLIRPGVRHRAIGRMTILNIVVPPFDPADEWFD